MPNPFRARRRRHPATLTLGASIAQRSPPIDSGMNLAFTKLRAGGVRLITLLVIIVVVWTLIRVVQFAGYLWRVANAPRIGVVTPT